MDFLEELKKCGYFYQCTNEIALSEKLKKQKICAYIGFDCTAKSLHVGNLMQVMLLRLLQKHGHKPIILIGSATTKIGDPTGKEEARKFLSDDEIQENVAGIKKSLSKFINFGNGPSDAIMLENSVWLDKIGYVDFLRNMGKMFSVNRMLTMDSVKLRLEREQSLTFLEFNYMLLQAYDFFHLNKEYDCCLQFGGSDQWGNIVTGIELIRKSTGKEVFGLTTPLLTTASGIKMGKSVSGAVWLNSKQLEPYHYYQYWRNIEDEDVIKFAKLYCEFTKQELDNFIEVSRSNINEAKKKLAHKVTLLCHGEDNANKALETSVRVFERGEIDFNLPTIDIDFSHIKNGTDCCSLFLKSGLVQSKGEARRLIKGKGARVNDEQITSESMIIDGNFIKDGVIKLSFGKKKHVLLKIVNDTSI